MGAPNDRAADDDMAPEDVQLLILKALQDGISTTAPAGTATALNQATQIAQGNTTTQVSAAKTAGQSVVIPALAKEWTVSIWTGTATVNGAAGCPAGFSDGSTKANAASITIAFDTPGTGYVRYAT